MVPGPMPTPVLSPVAWKLLWCGEFGRLTAWGTGGGAMLVFVVLRDRGGDGDGGDAVGGRLGFGD